MNEEEFKKEWKRLIELLEDYEPHRMKDVVDFMSPKLRDEFEKLLSEWT